jgi:hypothetical protein
LRRQCQNAHDFPSGLPFSEERNEAAPAKIWLSLARLPAAPVMPLSPGQDGDQLFSSMKARSLRPNRRFTLRNGRAAQRLKMKRLGRARLTGANLC